MDLITKDIDELQKIINEKKESLWDHKHKEKDKDHEHGCDNVHESKRENQRTEKGEQDKERAQIDREQAKRKEKPKDIQADVKFHEDKVGIQIEVNETSGGIIPLIILLLTILFQATKNAVYCLHEIYIWDFSSTGIRQSSHKKL